MPGVRTFARLLPPALLLACQSPAPEPGPAPAPVKPITPTPEPTPEPVPAKPPEPVATKPVVVPEGCKIVIDGQDSDTIKRALVNTNKGGLYDTTVVDGREITFECPPAEERKGANIIAEKTNAELVHWADVDLEPGGEGQALAAADAKPDLPEGLDEETLARLRAKWPDLATWEEPAAVVEDEVKVPVSFSANELYYAQLRLQHTDSKKTLRLELDPNAIKSLVPGAYKLSVRSEKNEPWQDAGTLEIEAGKTSYSVQMLDKPPRPKVTSK